MGLFNFRDKRKKNKVSAENETNNCNKGAEQSNNISQQNLLLEQAMKRTAQDKNQISIDSIAAGFAFAQLIIGTAPATNKSDAFDVLLMKVENAELFPLYTRMEFVNQHDSKSEYLAFLPERIIALIHELKLPIVINPKSDDRLVIPFELFEDVLEKRIIDKLQAKDKMEKIREKDINEADKLCYLVCNYLIEGEQNEKMEKIFTVLAYLKDNNVWVPMNANYSEEDANQILNNLSDFKPGSVIELKNDLRMKPDILKNDSGKLFFPVFSSKEEAPKEYRNKFSWVCMPFTQCCDMTKAHKECNDIIINAYTNSLIITPELIDIVLNHNK